MVIEQTVEIPVDHRLTIDVPQEIPAGKTVLVFRPVIEDFPCITVQEAIDRGLGLNSPSRIDPMEAIKRCSGIAKRLGCTLSSDDFLEMRLRDKELEDRLDSAHE